MPRRSSVLFIAGGALILAGLIGAFLAGRPAGNDDVFIPAHLGALPLTETRRGASAAAEIQRLHEGTFPVASAAVARYGSAGEAALWVAADPGVADEARLAVVEAYR